MLSSRFNAVGNICVLLSSLLAALVHAAEAPPVAEVRPVTDDYFGTKVVDPYRYFENLSDPEVKAWMKAQADYTQARLEAIPGRAALLKQIHELSASNLQRGSFARRGRRYFYLGLAPGEQLAKLYFRDDLDGPEHLLIDPETLGRESGTHFALDYFVPSGDGRYVAYGISSGGSEQSVMHVLEVDGGKVLDEAIPRTSNSVVSWLPDNRSFFYLRFPDLPPDALPAQTRYNARTYLHHLGAKPTGEGDPVAFGRGVSKQVDVPEGEGTYIVITPGSPYAIAVANHNMDANPVTLFAAPLASIDGALTPWKKLADVSDGVTRFVVRGDRLFFLSQKGFPRFRLLALPLAHPDMASAEEVFPQSAAVLVDFSAAKEGFYLLEREGALTKLVLIAPDGRGLHPVPTPFPGTVSRAVTDPRESGALYSVQSWVQSPKLMVYDAKADAASDAGLLPPSKLDTSGIESKEVFAVSYDGTRIPLSIIARKGVALDQSHPTILSGYGSYGSVEGAHFDPTSLAWLDRGGILAVAHIRGGGEYGEDWHKGGKMSTKLNTVFDFIACGQYLVDQHYTRPQLLAATGGSAGGIPVGGAMMWRPDLFSVILDRVGASDMLRMETEPNGPPNVSEFGSVTTEKGFHDLYAMSAYAHVRDGVAYPAALFSTGANDPRISPWHMMKMTARVQAATTSGKPVLLEIDFDAGHGIGSKISQREGQLADRLAFALWQMGDPAFQPTGKP